MKRTDLFDEMRHCLGDAIDILKDVPELAAQIEETKELGQRVQEMIGFLEQWHNTTIPALRPIVRPRADWRNAPRPSSPIIIKNTTGE